MHHLGNFGPVLFVLVLLFALCLLAAGRGEK